MRLGGVEHVVIAIDDGGRNLCVSRSESLEKESYERLLINRLVLFLCCIQRVIGGGWVVLSHQLCHLVAGKGVQFDLL